MAGHLATVFGVNHTYIEQARALLQEAPKAAQAGALR